LELYKSMSLCYMNFEKMDPRDESLWKRLHHYLMSNLACKILPIGDNDWVWFIGKMPSGDWDTSHGDSWIMLLLFCMFLVETCKEFPLYAEEIKAHWACKWIMFPTYGDDHNIIVRFARIAQMVNERRFALFLKKNFNITVRDIEEFWGIGKWMCIPDTNYTGEVKRKGVKFLQRQFYFDNEISQYVCTRDTSSVIFKVFQNTKRSDLLDVAASCVGVTMDSMGRNEVTYDVCKAAYEYVRYRHSKASQRDFDHDVFMHLLDDKYYANKVQQRLGRKPDEIIPGFPTLESLKKRNGGNYHFKKQFIGNFYDYDAMNNF